MKAMVILVGLPGGVLAPVLAELRKKYRDKLVLFDGVPSKKRDAERGVIYGSTFFDRLGHVLVQNGIATYDRRGPTFDLVIFVYRRPANDRVMFDNISEWAYMFSLQSVKAKNKKLCIKALDDIVSRINEIDANIGGEIRDMTRTPLLLPTEHFKCNRALIGMIQEIQYDHVVTCEHVRAFKKNWRKRYTEKGRRPRRRFYRDLDKRFFKPAEKGAQHGIAGLSGAEWNEVKKCAAGHFRLGFHYSSGFHFDVVNGAHINIYPNNFCSS
jgi:hypothetical protein